MPLALAKAGSRPVSVSLFPGRRQERHHDHEQTRQQEQSQRSTVRGSPNRYRQGFSAARGPCRNRDSEGHRRGQENPTTVSRASSVRARTRVTATLTSRPRTTVVASGSGAAEPDRHPGERGVRHRLSEEGHPLFTAWTPSAAHIGPSAARPRAPASCRRVRSNSRRFTASPSNAQAERLVPPVAGERTFSGRAFSHYPLVQQDDPVRGFPHEAQVVAHQKEREPVLALDFVSTFCEDGLALESIPAMGSSRSMMSGSCAARRRAAPAAVRRRQPAHRPSDRCPRPPSPVCPRSCASGSS